VAVPVVTGALCHGRQIHRSVQPPDGAGIGTALYAFRRLAVDLA
jgi:hypothetical protein